MKKPLVSIVIPMYQAEYTIMKTVDSIIQQTYPNIEIILVNDGSTDNTINICNKLVNQFPTIMLITQDNKGVSTARNNGITHMTGDYVLFLDSDDTLDSNAIDFLVEKAVSTDVDVVYFDFTRVTSNSTVISSANMDEGKYITSQSGSFFLEMIRTDIANNIGTKLFKSSIIKEKLVSYNEKYMICEDLMFCIDFMSHSSSFYYLKNSLYNYNIQSSNSLMSSYKLNNYAATMEMFGKLKIYLELHDSYKKNENLYFNLLMDRTIPLISNEYMNGYFKTNIINTVISNQEFQEAKKYVNTSNISTSSRIIYGLVWKKQSKHLDILYRLLHLKSKL